jgi:uncharacterized membrane protein YphA (DoxX/SURF4 family)
VDTVSSVAAIVLGAAFVLAGAAKLAAGIAWRSQAVQLGAPAWVAPWVPWVELVVGALLVSQYAEPVPAILAVALLIAFTGLIIVRLARGEHPPCACFGAWSAKPIGAAHVARNVVLLALAVFTAFRGGR